VRPREDTAVVRPPSLRTASLLPLPSESVTLLLAVYRQSVRLGDKPLITTNFVFQLNTCGYSHYVTSSLTRERVYPLQLLLFLASTVIFRSVSRPHFTVSDSRLSQTGGPGPRLYVAQEHVGPVIPPVTGFPFRRLLRLAGLRWRYSIPPPHRVARSRS
jgi:hypothetical protein